MSRIHDALKKAEEDKLAGRTPTLHPTLDEIASAPEPAPPVAALVTPSLDHRPATAIASAPDAGSDTLLQRCTNVHWRPNRAVSLFLETQSQVAPGMEEFRTLRARLFQIRANGHSRPSWFPARCRMKERASSPGTSHKYSPVRAEEEHSSLTAICESRSFTRCWVLRRLQGCRSIFRAKSTNFR